ncbi:MULTISPECIES: M48 family metalloprotease [Microbacterium]|uniref:M48 family metalloprotease n=1 Tax=Microbacterium TaxID=33882 RepID=UPI0007686405|nr:MULTISPECIES: M48 family metalloprotease [Microbacterium]KXC05812.1 protease [Microbacterium hominis]QOC25122.1 M48 family metalloprotease [Microbacterium hominis]QOC29161.1 M48 family metalloprotease [Microbacterium hominis]QYF98621.1 M48 family metalloprotease [Microbacterium sp. PAMC21962]
MYSAIARNKRNTWLILAGFVVVLGLIGLAAGWLAGNNWWITAFVLLGSAGYATVQYFVADREALALSGAQPVTKEEAPRYHRLVENLCISTGTPMPALYVVEDPAPNAFATGRTPDRAAITVTTGLFELMTDRELEGVLGHELGHIRNYDIRVSLVVFGLVVAVGLVADILLRIAFFGGGRRGGNNQSQLVFLIFGVVAAIVAPLLAALVQAAISRQREYLADATSALTTRDPDALASALAKLGEYGRPLAKANTSMAHLWISDPLRPGAVQRMFATHPPIPDRIARLEEMGGRF